MKMNKAIKVVIILVAILVMAIGCYTIIKKGLNFPENGIYSTNNLLEVAKPYIEKVAISTVLILIYFMIRYYKMGIIKVGIFSLISIVAVIGVMISIMAIGKLPVNEMLFPVLLAGFVATIVTLTIHYENKIKTL